MWKRFCRHGDLVLKMSIMKAVEEMVIELGKVDEYVHVEIQAAYAKWVMFVCRTN